MLVNIPYMEHMWFRKKTGFIEECHWKYPGTHLENHDKNRSPTLSGNSF